MNPNSKVTKIFRYMYLNRNRQVSAVELSNKMEIKLSNVWVYMKKLENRFITEKIKGRKYYQLKPKDINYIRDILVRTLGEDIEDEI